MDGSAAATDASAIARLLRPTAVGIAVVDHEPGSAVRRPRSPCLIDPRLKRAMRQKPQVALSQPPDTLRRSLIGGLVMLARADACIMQSTSKGLSDISRAVMRTWLDLAYSSLLTTQLITRLRAIELLANPRNHDWSYRASARKSPIVGADVFPEFEVPPSVAPRLLCAIVTLAGQVPSPLTVSTNKPGVKRRIAVPAVSVALAERVQEVLTPILAAERGVLHVAS